MSRKKADQDEARILRARGKFVPELLRWVTSPEHEITQDVDRIIDRVVKDRRRRIEVFLTALAKKYVERAVYFLGEMPRIEEELLDPDRIKTMKNSDLIRLLGVVADQVKDSSEFLRNFVSDDDLRAEPLPTPGAEFTTEPKEVEVEAVSDEDREAVEELSTESRQRIGGVLRKMLMHIDAAGKGSKPIPALEVPVTGDNGSDTNKKPKPKKAKGRKS